jgi:hypothetical protein
MSLLIVYMYCYCNNEFANMIIYVAIRSGPPQRPDPDKYSLYRNTGSGLPRDNFENLKPKHCEVLFI